jgi:tetratricopeptide (TPR) repeat protein
MSGGVVDNGIAMSEAEAHKFQSQYVEARNIVDQVLQTLSAEQDPFQYGMVWLNLAEIDICIGATETVIKQEIDKAKTIFKMLGYPRVVQLTEVLQADLTLREGDLLVARTVLQQHLTICRGRDSEIFGFCLERLGDVSRWNNTHGMTTWTTILFAHSLKSKERMGIHKAFQCLGDIFLIEGDGETALNLFTTALEGFTSMDIHRSRAECMLRLGDIASQQNNLLRALELWQTARSLFERSSQTKQVENVDQRLSATRGNGPVKIYVGQEDGSVVG